MAERKLLFIVEGENDEPKFLQRLLKVCYAKQGYQIYIYHTNLHTLAARLEKDYPDFTEVEVDIRLVLRSYEDDERKKARLSERYTDTFLIFDCEPHHDCPHFETIRQMLSVFSDSTSQGKLFINYPMMQSFKHLRNLPDEDFRERKVTIEECKKYKKLVGAESTYTDIGKYDYPVFMSLAAHHLKKAHYILRKSYTLPAQKDYLKWQHVEIFDRQMELKEQKQWVYVLNTCIFLLADYKPDAFFRQLADRQKRFFL